MDRDVYLILVGAGVSLASSIATLVFQFVINTIVEKNRGKRALNERRSVDIRASLLNGINDPGAGAYAKDLRREQEGIQPQTAIERPKGRSRQKQKAEDA